MDAWHTPEPREKSRLPSHRKKPPTYKEKVDELIPTIIVVSTIEGELRCEVELAIACLNVALAHDLLTVRMSSEPKRRYLGNEICRECIDFLFARCGVFEEQSSPHLQSGPG